VIDEDQMSNQNPQLRGRIIHRVFHGATDLLRVECDAGLVLTVRTARSPEGDLIELEFSPADAICVRESPERP